MGSKAAASTLTVLSALLLAAVSFELPLQLPKIPGLEHIESMININGSLPELPNIIYFPDDNGNPVPGQIYGNTTLLSWVQPSDLSFKLHTRRSQAEGEVITAGDVDSLRSSHFNASKVTYIITHGFQQSIRSSTIRSLIDTYLDFQEANVIAVDWSNISKNPLYFIAARQLKEVGRFVAEFTAFLVREGGTDLSRVHLIGYSLGAHVVGIAGKNIRLMVGRKPGRITGLDPAGPLFSVFDKPGRLDKDDADFVDVIHTCGGWIGMVASIGHADFYPNGGTMAQPGCSWDLVTVGVCSHSRSWEYFIESIKTNRFVSQPCASYVHYQMGTCGDGVRVPMGHHTPPSASGNYYLKTAEAPPFAIE